MAVPEQAQSPGHAAYLEARGKRVTAVKACLEQAFPEPAKLVLEIGCGHGHYLTAYAQQHPDAFCLGVDLVTKRIEKANQKRDKRGLERLHFIKAEIRECLEAWPAHLGLDRVFILFPDPWPKKRHIKNRVLQTSLLDALAGRAGAGTQLHFRTDHPDNFAWGMSVIASHPLWEIRDDIEWPLENPSYFQDLFEDHYSLTALRAAPAGEG